MRLVMALAVGLGVLAALWSVRHRAAVQLHGYGDCGFGEIVNPDTGECE